MMYYTWCYWAAIALIMKMVLRVWGLNGYIAGGPAAASPYEGLFTWGCGGSAPPPMFSLTSSRQRWFLIIDSRSGGLKTCESKFLFKNTLGRVGTKLCSVRNFTYAESLLIIYSFMLTAFTSTNFYDPLFLDSFYQFPLFSNTLFRTHWDSAVFIANF